MSTNSAANEGAWTPDIGPELVERMAALIRDLNADHVKHGAHDYVQDFVARTAEIVAELPEAVDPDLLEAREISAVHVELLGGSCGAAKIRAGGCDDNIRSGVPVVLAAIKRGRELERSLLTEREGGGE